ncbi:MAG: hypothetical protein ACI3YZ_04640 [Prevotella sp.]
MEETRKELSEYEKARIQYRDCDYKNAINTAIREGYKEGYKEGLREGFEKVSIDVARQLKAEGISNAVISRITDLPEEKIEEL